MTSDEIVFSLRGLKVDGLTRLYVLDTRDRAIFYGCPHPAWVLMDHEGEVQAFSESEISDEVLSLIGRGSIREYPVSPAVVGTALVECLTSDMCRSLLAVIRSSLEQDADGHVLSSEEGRKAEDAIRTMLAHLPRQRVETLRHFILKKSETSMAEIWPTSLFIHDAAERLIQLIQAYQDDQNVVVFGSSPEAVWRELLFRARTLYLEQPQKLSASHVYALFKPTRWTSNGEMFLDWLRDFGDQGHQTLTVEFPLGGDWHSSRTQANVVFDAKLSSVGVTKAEAIKAAMQKSHQKPFRDDHFDAWCSAVDEGLDLLYGDFRNSPEHEPIRARFVHAPPNSFLF